MTRAAATFVVALAATVPTPAQTAGIRAAIADDPRTCCGRGTYRVVDVRVSSVAASFAAATVRPDNRKRDGAYVLLWHGTKRWVVIDAGTDFLGCGLIPGAVRKDLFGTMACR